LVGRASIAWPPLVLYSGCVDADTDKGLFAAHVAQSLSAAGSVTPAFWMPKVVETVSRDSSGQMNPVLYVPFSSQDRPSTERIRFTCGDVAGNQPAARIVGDLGDLVEVFYSRQVVYRNDPEFRDYMGGGRDKLSCGDIRSAKDVLAIR